MSREISSSKIDCYAAEHTLSIEDAVEDIMLLCQKNGGRVGC
ncbi:DUF3791 domain-containing protein [Leyella stercorea]|nr:DUF3791 domain-containing protein [Leyella stercorea]